MKENNEKIDNLDRKILYYLDRNSRQPATTIAKKCRVHKNVISFRINRLIKKGIIREFTTMVRPSALGLTPYKIYLKIESFTKEKEKELFKLIKTLPTYWAARVSGKWDVIVGLLVHNTQELSTITTKLQLHLGKDIITKTISVIIQAPHYYRTYLGEDKQPTVKYWLESTSVSIDATDKKILRVISRNARTPIIELAKKTGINVKTCMNHLKQLQKKGIIYDYRLALNLEAIGYRFFKCFITLNTDKKQLQSFYQYCLNDKNITHVIQCVGEWDIEPEFEIESEKAFLKKLEEMREQFPALIKHIETITVLKEYTYTCIP